MADIYQTITDRIVSLLETGVRPWHQPWSAGNAAARVSRPLRHNGQPYSGINVLVLWMEATARGYGNPCWMTFRQAKELGGCVRKGERSATVVYANRYTKTETDGEGNEIEQTIPFLKSYAVFNVEQIDGLPASYQVVPDAPQIAPDARIDELDRFFAATGADIRHGGLRAFYAIQPDYIQMPPFEAFESAESYYCTLAHEMTHWTRHPTRLDRDFGRKKWGDEGYAREELVAEIGAAFLSVELGFAPEVREDHAAYIASWLKVLKDDKRFIFSAAAHAERACAHLHSYSNPEAIESEAA